MTTFLPIISAVRSSRRFARAALLVALALASGTSAAALYKWTDAQGRVFYSDQPPPAGANVKAEKLTPPPPPADANAVKDMAGKDADFRKRQQERVDQAKKADKSKADTEKRAESCGRMRGHLKVLDGDDAVYQVNEQGERVYMDEDAKAKERERLQAMVRDLNCPSN
jgi:uncharacterized protein DUF4124